MEFSLAYEMQRPVLDDHAVIEETIEQCILADEMGFDAVWFVEHHFLTTFSGSPCPEVIFGALSRLTKRIRLGFGVVILPYHHPIRVAERVAMVDHLSNGRVEFGTGRSAPYEQLGMGIDPRDTREMWEESLTMIPKIWESDYFEWDGKFWKVPPRQVLPKPYQKPHPPIWVAALQPTTYQLAAQKGIGSMALGVNAPSVLEPSIREYKTAIKESNPVGAFANNKWLSSCFGLCGEDDAATKELSAQSLKTFFGPGPSLRPGPEGCLLPAVGAVGGRARPPGAELLALRGRPGAGRKRRKRPRPFRRQRPGPEGMGGVRCRHDGRARHNRGRRPGVLHQGGETPRGDRRRPVAVPDGHRDRPSQEGDGVHRNVRQARHPPLPQVGAGHGECPISVNTAWQPAKSRTASRALMLIRASFLSSVQAKTDGCHWVTM